MSKIQKSFDCKYCNIKTNNKKDYNKHILTLKHTKLTNVNTKIPFFPNNIEQTFICVECKKRYNSRVGLCVLQIKTK